MLLCLLSGSGATRSLASQWGLRIRNVSVARGSLEVQRPGPRPDTPNQNLCPNQIPRCSVCTLRVRTAARKPLWDPQPLLVLPTYGDRKHSCHLRLAGSCPEQ